MIELLESVLAFLYDAPFMRRDDLLFSYPEDLVATAPCADFRIAALTREGPAELSHDQLWAQFSPGDLLVVNDTQVEPRRVFAGEHEILFVRPTGEMEWEVLFAARDLKIGETLVLPGDVKATLVQKGLPQRLLLNQAIGAGYFEKHGEPALPPYIQRVRNERHCRPQDHEWYRNQWGLEPGSAAAPTASLHFHHQDLARLGERGVEVASLTLHVGLGTFMPIKSEILEDHKMHAERAYLPRQTLERLVTTKESGGKVWALGTTVTRALEAWAAGHLTTDEEGGMTGETQLFIRPGHPFQVVDGLLTNFHQPGSTLLALVAAFAGLEKTLELYRWAIDRRFRLFSYGDLTVWRRE